MVRSITNDETKALSRETGLAGLARRLFSGKARSASLDESVRVYAIGDIHGCVSELDRLMDSIIQDRSTWNGQCYLIFVGDYIDRGPDSKAVISRLLKAPDGFEVYYLRGNHDQTLLDFLEDPSVYRVWRDFGGRETLLSYGVHPPHFDDADTLAKTQEEFRKALPHAHLAFFHDLQLSAKVGNYFFAHAGVRPGTRLDKQKPEDLLWIRDEFLYSAENFGMVVVHGHTPSTEPVLRQNRIGIDTGAYATGRLTAVVLEGNSQRFLCS